MSTNLTRRGDRGLGKTAAGGNNGSFAGHERAAAAAPQPTPHPSGATLQELPGEERDRIIAEFYAPGIDFYMPAHSHPSDDLDEAALNAAVDFDDRMEEIRQRWEADRNDPEAERLCAALLRDTVQYRFPAADSMILTMNYTDEGESLQLNEVRDVDDTPIAHDEYLGALDESERSYRDSVMLGKDEVWASKIWPIADGARRGPGYAEEEDSGADRFRMHLRPIGTTPYDHQAVARARILTEPSTADRDEVSVEAAAREIGHPIFDHTGAPTPQVRALASHLRNGVAPHELQAVYDQNLHGRVTSSGAARLEQAGYVHRGAEVARMSFNERFITHVGSAVPSRRERAERAIQRATEGIESLRAGNADPEDYVNPALVEIPDALKGDRDRVLRNIAIMQLERGIATNQRMLDSGGVDAPAYRLEREDLLAMIQENTRLRTDE